MCEKHFWVRKNSKHFAKENFIAFLLKNFLGFAKDFRFFRHLRAKVEGGKVGVVQFYANSFIPPNPTIPIIFRHLHPIVSVIYVAANSENGQKNLKAVKILL